METRPLVTERVYDAKIEKVWQALTDKDQMKEWYFDIPEFRAEKGFKFSFYGGDETEKFLHACEILEVDAPNKLSYSWIYPDRPGYSVVTFELFKEAEKKTRVRLTHDGLDSFPQDDPKFAVSSFTEGWNYILGDSLRSFVETDNIKKSVSIAAPANVIWKLILNPDDSWGAAFGGGAFVKSDWKVGSEVIWTDTDGNIVARGLVQEIRENEYLQVDMFDDVNAAVNSPTGNYSEKYRVKQDGGNKSLLEIESGEIPKKYTAMHGEMWDKAISIIKEKAEEGV